ncbi:MAG: hypothetical protein LBE12_20420 [Planctomycetaceae bacterium]|jgi:hypothetical protein|nr:hypothetical protein [Planctomycetaceae bacterium]
MTEKELYPSINDLVNAKEISIRTGNYCGISGIESLYDLLVNYENEGSKKRLEISNTNSKTYIELDWLYESMVSLFPLRNQSLLDTNESKKIMEYFKSLLSNSFKCRAIHEKYNQLMHSYSVRSKIWLTKIPLDIFVSEYLCFYDNQSLKVRHFFVNSLPETTDLKEKLKTEITRQFYLSEEDSIREEIRDHYGLSESIDFPLSYYMKHRCFPMFWILEKQLENYVDRDFDVLKKTFKICQNQQQTSLNELATKYSISCERVRQIGKHTFRAFVSRRSLFLNKYRNDWEHYKPLNKDVIWEQDMQQYIDDEQSNFSPKFILQILLNLLYYNDYTLYGGFLVSGKINPWKISFLVNNDFSEIFNFNKFRTEFQKSLNKNKLPHLLDPVNYVAKCECWKKYSVNKKDGIASIITDILRYEFNMNPEKDGCFKIPVKIKLSMFDIVYEILKDNGNPMHIDSIFAELKNRYPTHHYSKPSQLRHYLLKHKAVACQSRKNVYVLKEWTHVKSGTIRDLIIELLTKKRLPQTAQNITEYVKQYFPETNTASVRTSMLNDTKKRFILFQNGLFGLSRKKYPPKYEPADNTLPSFDQRLSDIEKFLVENGHFPFVSSKNKDEKILSAWWARVIKGIYDANETKRNEIERIKTQYAGCDENKRIFQWNENCERMKRFLLENHKMPTIITDKFLYFWLGRAKTDYLKHRMNETQQQKYLELIKLIEKN